MTPTFRHVNPGVVGRATYRALVAGGNPGGWHLPAGPETCTAVMVTGGVRWGRRTLLGQRLPVPRGPEPLTRAEGLVSELIERVVAHWGSSTFSPLRGARHSPPRAAPVCFPDLGLLGCLWGNRGLRRVPLVRNALSVAFRLLSLAPRGGSSGATRELTSLTTPVGWRMPFRRFD